MKLLSPAEQCDRQRNLLFFTQPQLWPLWPYLPLMRRIAGKEEEYGLLFDAKSVLMRLGLSATVFACNYFLLPPSLEEFLALPHETFDTPEEMADAGWTVD